MLQDHLRSMGKIQVFHQMMEVIQVKTMSKEGTPLPVTEDVDAIVADIFKRNDVDFEKLTSELTKDTLPSARFANTSKKLD
jgi:RNase P/RNase MRP subunit p30